MDNNESTKKDKLISLGVTLLVHALLIVLLVFLGFKHQIPQEESGVLLMVGQVDLSAGDESSVSDASDNIEPQPEPVTPSSPAPQPEDPIIAQNIEDAPAIEQEEKKKKEEETKRKEEEIRRQAEEEAKRKAEEEARRKAEEEARKRAAAQNLVAGAFGKNSGTGTEANGVQGTPNGNSDQGATKGNAGYGQYDLGGRGIIGSLPRPSFDINTSGKVVVLITVDPQGNVIDTGIAAGTTTSSQALRNAAIAAAKKARFAEANGIGNQQGTITYLFDSNN